MKKLIIVMCLLVAGCVYGEPNDVNTPEGMSFRILTEPSSQNANLEGWIGYQKDNSEVGFILGYVDEETEEDSSWSVGGFASYQFPDVRQSLEGIFWPIEALPAAIEATPSIGLAITYKIDTSAIEIRPYIGLKFLGSFEIVTSYRGFFNETSEADGIQIGISKVFEF